MPTTCSEDTLFTDNIADSIYTSGEKENKSNLFKRYLTSMPEQA
jgi:hypothetical protein